MFFLLFRSPRSAEPRVGSQDANQVEAGFQQHPASPAPRAGHHLLRVDDHGPRPPHPQHPSHGEVPPATPQGPTIRRSRPEHGCRHQTSQRTGN